MKKVILLLTAVFVGQTGFSQVSIDPEVGINVSKMPTKFGTTTPWTPKSIVGTHVGLGVHLDLHNGIYVKPGIYYNRMGGEMNVLGVTSTTKLNYINIPINLGYNYQISDKIGALFLEAGPQVGYALSGFTHAKGVLGFLGIDKKTDISFGGKKSETNPFDWGFNFGLGYETPWGVYLKGTYGLGMNNISNDVNTEIKNDNWNVSLGYRMKL